ncbi:MAG: hypothetical protein J6B04_06925 [Clostridia bacterium]|nr:hypothetical protein [Clostridia bacterium]
MRKLLSFLLILCIYSLTACTSTATEHEIISKDLGVDVSKGQVQIYRDDHGGFHGDGETYAKITFSDESFYNAIQNNAEWARLPLTQILTVVVYGGTLPNGDSWESFIKDEDDKLLIPSISDGYYFFKDRHIESKSEKEDSPIFDRYSMNFTLAIYDSQSKVLYFYEIDT